MTEACLSGPSPCLRSSAWLTGEQSQGWAMGPRDLAKEGRRHRGRCTQTCACNTWGQGGEGSGIHCPPLRAQSRACGRQADMGGVRGTPGAWGRSSDQAPCLLCPTSQRNCLPSGGGRPLRRGLPWVGIPAPWRVLRVIPRGPGDAPLLSWGAREGEPHFLSQRDPREMRPQRPRAQEPLVVGAAGSQ